jgi:ketosteroid isomerase-like protein
MASTSTIDNKRRMRAVMAALADGDGRPFIDLMADDIVWIMPGTTAWSGRYEGKQAVLDKLLRPVHAQFEGRYRNHVSRDTKRGAPYNNTYCWMCRFDADGQMKELVEYMDTQLVNDALAPPAGS